MSTFLSSGTYSTTRIRCLFSFFIVCGSARETHKKEERETHKKEENNADVGIRCVLRRSLEMFIWMVET